MSDDTTAECEACGESIASPPTQIGRDLVADFKRAHQGHGTDRSTR